MSWTKLILASRTRPGGVTLRIGPVKKVEPEPRLQIRITGPLAASVGLSSKDNGHADVYLGEGADSGLMKVTHAAGGVFRCRKGNASGGVQIITEPPPGAPGALDPIALGESDVTVKAGAITFRLPWHRLAADRVIEEIPVNVTVAGEQFDTLIKTLGDPPPPDDKLKKLMARKPPWEAPATLDEIEEDARPVRGCSPAAVAVATLEDIKKLADQIAEEVDPPVNGSAKTHVYADSQPAEKLTFTHKGKSCLLAKNQHAVVTALYKVMTKNGPGHFLGDEYLVKVSGASSKEVMQAVVSAARKPIAPLGLKIEPQPGVGYWLKEMED